MSDEEIDKTLTDLDPDPTTPVPTADARLALTAAQRQELALSARTPTEEDVEDGEVFDPVTGAYANPGWDPPGWVPPVSDEDQIDR